MKYIILSILTIITVFLLLNSITSNPKYSTVQEDCDMQGIINKTNLSDKNLTACNYFEN